MVTCHYLSVWIWGVRKLPCKPFLPVLEAIFSFSAEMLSSFARYISTFPPFMERQAIEISPICTGTLFTRGSVPVMGAQLTRVRLLSPSICLTQP